MSDRSVFLTAFLAVILLVAGAFAIHEYFYFELLKSTMFVVIAVMVFFGENRFSYMLGMTAPALAFILNLLLGGFFDEFVVLWNFITGQLMARVDTPFHGLAILTIATMSILCFRAWRKQVPEKLFGKTFGICLAISFAYIGIVLFAYLRTVPSGAPMP